MKTKLAGKTAPKTEKKSAGISTEGTRDARFLLPRLGVNIDHIATLRQLRQTPYPSITEAARIVEKAGAHQITVHLREDRRHIQDEDVYALRKSLGIALNLEMAMSAEITKIAHKVKPEWVCLVPEKRTEVTTEGGLDVKKYMKPLSKMMSDFRKKKIKVSLFIEPDTRVVELSHELGADAVELHTGRYCNAKQGFYKKDNAKIAKEEFKRIVDSSKRCHEIGIHAHAGHGFDYDNVRDVVALDLVEEYNIGHSIVCRAAMVGLDQAVREMLSAVQAP